MPYPRLTLTQRIAQAVQDAATSRIYDATTGSVADVTMLEHSPLRTMAVVASGAAYEEDGYIDWVALQANPWSATEDGYATDWGALRGVARKSAAAATTTRALSGTPGTVVTAGTVFSLPGGVTYATAAEVTLDGSGVGTVALIATVLGAAGNAPAGAVLTPTLTIAGLTVVVGGPVIAGGADIEAFPAFKARYLAVYASPAQGGAASDYVRWALAVPGVTRAWDSPLGAGAGTVVVYTMWDMAEAANGGFPQGADGVATAESRDAPAVGEQLVVANALHPLRPATALVYHCAPRPFPVPFTFMTRMAVPATVQAMALAALDAVFLALADPLGGVLDLSPFDIVVSSVDGMPTFTRTAPNAEFAAPIGFLPVRGAVTWSVMS